MPCANASLRGARVGTPKSQAFLQVGALDKSFFGVKVLKEVGFTLQKGEVLGLVGENGSGKSTTMNILGGIHQPDAGQMVLDGKPYRPAGPKDAQLAGLAFIHQELNLFENLSIEENIFINGFPRHRPWLPFINRREISTKTKQLLDLVDLSHSPRTPVSKLSQGERQLVEIAKALGFDAQVIIFDEPTTSLSRRETEKLFTIVRRLKTQGIGVIYISHILGDVLQICDTVHVLRDGALVGHGARDDMSIDKIISLMVGRQIENLFPSRDSQPGEVVLEATGLTQPGVVKDVGFSLRSGEVLGVSGLMGAGRSELARILFGLDPHKSGSIKVEGKALENPSPETCMARGLAFLTEDRRGEGLLMEASIRDNVALSSLQSYANGIARWVSWPRLDHDVAEVSGKVQVNTSDYVRMLVKNLSGGNQQKVVFAKWLLRQPRIFILDEPTRGIDVGAKLEVYKIINQLVADGAAVLLISSEIEELIGMCDRIMVMSRGEVMGFHERSEFDSERILETAMSVDLKELV